jgi:hypothetical protein
VVRNGQAVRGYWPKINRELKKTFGIFRGATALTNQWTRLDRAYFNIDERNPKNVTNPSLSTSQLASMKRREAVALAEEAAELAAAEAAAEAAAGGEEEEEDDEDEEEEEEEEEEDDEEEEEDDAGVISEAKDGLEERPSKRARVET